MAETRPQVGQTLLPLFLLSYFEERGRKKGNDVDRGIDKQRNTSRAQWSVHSSSGSCA
jgi:hypothetical protein